MIGGVKVAVRIRLTRKGAKKAPFYRIVVADSRHPRDGRFIDIIGCYNPASEPVELSVNTEKALHWLNTGAKPSDTARALLKKAGIFDAIRDQKKNQAEEAEPQGESLAQEAEASV